MRYKTTPRPEAIGLPDEDNFQIEVWDQEGGQLLGIALRTTLGGTMPQAWRAAVEAYPGKYLVWTNGNFAIQTAVTPAEKPDQFGWIEPGNIRLLDLPQWYGLVARCACKNLAHIDRYDPRVTRWKHLPLPQIAEEKLSCNECTKAERARQPMKIGLVKLPR